MFDTKTQQLRVDLGLWHLFMSTKAKMLIATTGACV